MTCFNLICWHGASESAIFRGAHKSHYAAARLAAVPGLRINPDTLDAMFFKEFTVELPIPAAKVNEALLKDHDIIGGFDLGRFYPGQENRMLLAVTEMNSCTEIDRLVDAMGKAITR